MGCAILSLQLLLEKWLRLEEWIENLNTPPFVADEICIYILSKILGFGIAIILRNWIWTTTDCNDMTGCDAYFAYCGGGILYT